MNRKRNRFCVLYFIAVTLVVCPTFNASVIGNVNLVELEKMVRPVVVTIETYDKKGKPLGSSSGFFINKQGHLITNYHVLKGAYSAMVKTFDGKEYSVKLVLAESETTDLIKVSVDIPEQTVKFIELSQNTPEVGNLVIVVGNPWGLKQTVSEGVISGIRDIPAIGKVFQISTAVSLGLSGSVAPGSSGSPVINMKGQVIGVATTGPWSGEQNICFAISGEQVLALNLQKNEKTPAEWTSSISGKETGQEWDLYLKGLVFIWAGEYEKSLVCFKKIIDLNKFSAGAWFYAGCCYDKLGRHLEEIEAYKQTILIKPVNLQDYLIVENAYLNLGIVYYELGRNSEAIKAYKQAININPDLADAHYNLGIIYSKLGRNNEAIEAYKHTIRIKPEHAEAHYNLGTTYGNLGRYQQEIKAYRQAIHIKPDYAKAYYNLGVSLDGLRRYQDAIEAFKQAIRIKPDYVDAQCYLGAAYGKLGRHREATEAFKQAIRINPNCAKAHFNLGLTYFLVGDKSSAREEYRILKDLDKDLANELFNLIYK